MSPESEPAAALLAMTRQVQAEFGGRVEELCAEGFEVDVFLEACAEMAAKLERGDVKGAELRVMMKRFEALVDEMREAQRLHRQAEAVKAATELPEAVVKMGRMAVHLRERGQAMDVRSAEDIEASVARIVKGLGKGRLDREALMDMQLTAGAQMAELDRRVRFRSAACGLYWEQWPEERWARLSPEERRKLEGMLESWRRDKERLLGSLPLEDRRRLEAMRYEDFDKPGACDP